MFPFQLNLYWAEVIQEHDFHVLTEEINGKND